MSDKGEVKRRFFGRRDYSKSASVGGPLPQRSKNLKIRCFGQKINQGQSFRERLLRGEELVPCRHKLPFTTKVVTNSPPSCRLYAQSQIFIRIPIIVQETEILHLSARIKLQGANHLRYLSEFPYIKSVGELEASGQKTIDKSNNCDFIQIVICFYTLTVTATFNPKA